MEYHPLYHIIQYWKRMLGNIKTVSKKCRVSRIIFHSLLLIFFFRLCVFVTPSQRKRPFTWRQVSYPQERIGGARGLNFGKIQIFLGASDVGKGVCICLQLHRIFTENTSSISPASFEVACRVIVGRYYSCITMRPFTTVATSTVTRHKTV